MIQDNKVLTSLALGSCGLSPEGISEICDVIRINTVLRSLNLSGNTFEGQSITSLGKTNSSYQSTIERDGCTLWACNKCIQSLNI